MKQICCLAGVGVAFIIGMMGCGGGETKDTPDDGGIEIKVDFGQSKPFADNCESIQVVALDSATCFPGEVLSSVIKGDTVYMVDRYVTPGLYAYTINGKKVFVYDKIGQGPGEVISPVDVQVSGDSVYVLDSQGMKVVTLNREGNFYKNTTVPYGHGFMIDDDGSILIDRGNQVYDDGKGMLARVNDGRISWVGDVPEYLENVTIVTPHSFTTYEGEAHLMPSMQPKIVKLHGEEFQTLYSFDFGAHWIPKTSLEGERHPLEIMKELVSGGYVRELRYQEGKDLICVSFVQGMDKDNSDIYFLLFDREGKRQALYKIEKSRLDHPLSFDSADNLVFLTGNDTPTFLVATMTLPK